MVSIQNERLAEYCAANPERFVAFASVALQFPDLAAQQLEHGVKELGLRGAAVGATVGDDEFADPKFHPFWAKAEELGVLIFLHPQGTPDLARRLGGNGWLTNTIGNPLDTTIALSHLIFEGTLDRFPGFKILQEYAPGAFAGYGLMRNTLMQERPAGALDMKTKELIFAVLDTVVGDKFGAINHAIAAMKLGLTLQEMAEGIVQAIMVGGITTWNLVGYELMVACIDHANGKEPAVAP